jgi:ribosomal protein L16 Arg81 hydroxylase
VTSLHYDSYDNLLSQVCGFKYVRLYAPSETQKLYVHAGGSSGTSAQGNISAVKVEEPDLAAYPLFAEAVYEEAILGPGDVLFIPKVGEQLVQCVKYEQCVKSVQSTVYCVACVGVCVAV